MEPYYWPPVDDASYQALASAPLSHHGIETIPNIGMPMQGGAGWPDVLRVGMCAVAWSGPGLTKNC